MSNRGGASSTQTTTFTMLGAPLLADFARSGDFQFHGSNCHNAEFSGSAIFLTLRGASVAVLSERHATPESKMLRLPREELATERSRTSLDRASKLHTACCRSGEWQSG